MRSIRFKSITVSDVYKATRSLPFVPAVHWRCGHSAFVPDYFNPGDCQVCGCPDLEFVDMNPPKFPSLEARAA